VFLYFMVPRGETVLLTSLKLRSKSGALKNPSYVQLTGGLRDGRKNPSAHTGKATGNGAPLDPAVKAALGPSYTDWLQIAILFKIMKGISQVSVNFDRAMIGLPGS
jgi:hypothetical protein